MKLLMRRKIWRATTIACTTVLSPGSVSTMSAAARAAKQAAAAETDETQKKQQKNSHVVPVRTYDLSITYDKYYQVPRFWLAGFDEDRRPLGAEALLEDVAAEHARKTVTMEPHPHLSSSSASSPSASASSSSSSIKVASIHPCRHAAVMKKLASMGAAAAEAAASAGTAGGTAATATAAPPLDPEAYLVLFLKFIASVIPTIEYDFTMHASVGGGGR